MAINRPVIMPRSRRTPDFAFPILRDEADGARCSLDVQLSHELVPLVTTENTWRRPIVPVSIKRQVPPQIADDLDVIRGIGVEAKTAGSESAGRSSAVISRLVLLDLKNCAWP